MSEIEVGQGFERERTLEEILSTERDRLKAHSLTKQNQQLEQEKNAEMTKSADKMAKSTGERLTDQEITSLCNDNLPKLTGIPKGGGGDNLEDRRAKEESIQEELYDETDTDFESVPGVNDGPFNGVPEIDWSKPIQLLNGDPLDLIYNHTQVRISVFPYETGQVSIYITDADGVCNSDGVKRIINVPEKRKLEGWVVKYEGFMGFYKKAPPKSALKDLRDFEYCIDLSKYDIEYEEGEGLDDE